MFGEEKVQKMEHEVLKQNHEFLKLENESLQLVILRLQEECESERSEKNRYKRVVEEMKKNSETIDEFKKKNEELLLENQTKEEVALTMTNKYLDLADRLRVVEGECEYLTSLYEAEVAVSGTPSVVMSKIGDCDHLIGQGVNEVNGNLNSNTAIDVIVLSDDESNGDRNQEEQCQIRANSSTQNQVSGEIITTMAANHPQPLPASSTSSSSSSSSSSYLFSSSDDEEYVTQLST